MAQLANIRRFLQKESVEALLVFDPVNKHYLTVFTGSFVLALISSTKQVILTDFRYIEQAKLECPTWVIIKAENIINALTITELVVGCERFACIKIK